MSKATQKEIKKWIENARYLTKKLKQQSWEDVERHITDFTESAIINTLKSLLQSDIKELEGMKEIAQTRKRMTPFQDTLFNYEVNVLDTIIQKKQQQLEELSN